MHTWLGFRDVCDTCLTWSAGCLVAHASLAQLVEHALRKRMVVGSIPTGGFCVRLRAPACRVPVCGRPRLVVLPPPLRLLLLLTRAEARAFPRSAHGGVASHLRRMKKAFCISLSCVSMRCACYGVFCQSRLNNARPCSNCVQARSFEYSVKRHSGAPRRQTEVLPPFGRSCPRRRSMLCASARAFVFLPLLLLLLPLSGAFLCCGSRRHCF